MFARQASDESRARESRQPRFAGTAPRSSITPISVLVVDDHPLIREYAADAIEGDRRLELVGRAADGVAAIELAELAKPAVILLDAFMPQMGGDRVLRRLREDQNPARVLVFTAGPTPDLHDILDQSPDALLYKDSSIKQLCDEIVAVFEAEEHSRGHLLLRDAQALAVARPAINPRELRLLRCVADGMMIKEVALRLDASKSTIEQQLRAIREKLHAPTNAAAVSRAYEIGYLGGSHRQVGR